MGRGKGYYNKDTERVRQQKQQLKGKYKNATAVRLKENLTGESMQSEIENDFTNLYENHYNGYYSGFAKKILEKNHFKTYKNFKDHEDPEDQNLHDYKHLEDPDIHDFVQKAFAEDLNLQRILLDGGPGIAFFQLT